MSQRVLPQRWDASGPSATAPLTAACPVFPQEEQPQPPRRWDARQASAGAPLPAEHSLFQQHQFENQYADLSQRWDGPPLSVKARLFAYRYEEQPQPPRRWGARQVSAAVPLPAEH